MKEFLKKGVDETKGTWQEGGQIKFKLGSGSPLGARKERKWGIIGENGQERRKQYEF